MSDTETNPPVVGRLEPVRLLGVNGETTRVGAKLDTATYRTSIDKSLLKTVGQPDKLDGTARTRSGDNAEDRVLVPIHIALDEYTDLELVAVANVKDRSNKTGDLLIGYNDLTTWGVHVDPAVDNCEGTGLLSDD